MATAKNLCKEKTDKNAERLCKNYGQIFTDCYRKTMPISKIMLNLKYLTMLGCGIGIEVLTQAVYTCSKISYTKYICHYKIS